MFRMVPHVTLDSTDRGRPVGPIRALIAGAVVVSVATLGLFALEPPTPDEQRSETAMAQLSAAVVATTYRAEVAIDRRDRMLLVSYDQPSPISADRLARSVCDTIRTAPEAEGSGRVLRDWQVVAMPAAGLPGSCRIGADR